MIEKSWQDERVNEWTCLVDEWTSRQVNELLAREDKVTDEQVFSGRVDEWTSEQVTCKRRQGNRWTGV